MTWPDIGDRPHRQKPRLNKGVLSEYTCDIIEAHIQHAETDVTPDISHLPAHVHERSDRIV